MSKDDQQHRQWLHIPSRRAQSPGQQNVNNQLDSSEQQPEPASHHTQSSEGAANVARTQINHIYETNPPHQTETDKEQGNNNDIPDTYTRQRMAGGGYDWQTYHTAWQNYYQQYYHRYYLQQLHAQRQKQLQERAKDALATPSPANNTAFVSPQSASEADKLRQEIRSKVGERAKKLRGSSHFLPIASAVVVGLLFFLVQFNKVIAAQVHAYVSPSATISDNVIVDPSASVPVGKAPRLIIPKINVDAPLVFGLDSLDNGSTQTALEDGIVHYPIPGASSLPGQTGNSVFLGHSSHTVWNAGKYKFVFVLLPRLEKDDLFYIHYEGKRYIYRVTKKQVIKPSQVNELVIPSNKPMATLVTCVPIGTNAKRLLVFAEQISPDPTKAEKIETVKPRDQHIKIPGNEPTLLERLFN